MIDALKITQVFQSLVGRPANQHERDRCRAMPSLAAVVASVIESDEYQARFAEGYEQIAPMASELGRHAALLAPRKPDPYLAPDDLELTDVGPSNVLLVGACFVFGWPDMLAEIGIDVRIDRVLFAHCFRLPEAPPAPIETYDCQIVQVPLPSILPDLDHLRIDYDDPAAYEALLDRAVQLLEMFLDEALVWSDRVPTFVLNYLTPQQNLLGRMLPRYDLRNPIHLVERINMELDAVIRGRRGMRVLDVDRLAGVCGRRFIQEDMLWPQFHGQMMEGQDRNLDEDKTLDVSQFYDVALHEYLRLMWQEIRASYRIIKGADAVKLVCVDLDNTLWRGVTGDLDGASPMQIVGWPQGLAEVLVFLKRRGIMLAILSKNDEARVRDRWDVIFEGKLRLGDFAAIKINWQPKPDNLGEILNEINILPQNVVFLDDSPIERAAMRAAFPDVRIIEASHYHWRRILGSSAELQRTSITDESVRRTEMVQAQIGRERVRKAMSRDDFLSSLELGVRIVAVHSQEDPRFVRSFELLNKTNQFNTTGHRWSEAEARTFLARGGTWWTFDVIDRFSDYGLVGVVCVDGNRIEQFVMSCRVAGLDLEHAVLSRICPAFADRHGLAEGVIRHTDYNAVLADLYKRIGWAEAEGVWRGGAVLDSPAHVRFLDDTKKWERSDERAVEDDGGKPVAHDAATIPDAEPKRRTRGFWDRLRSRPARGGG
jgi:FkbH-like protein